MAWSAAFRMADDTSLYSPAAVFFEMTPVLLVFVTDHLQNVSVRDQDLSDLYREGSRVHLGVVDGYAQIHVAEVAAVEALLNVHILAMGVARNVEPVLVVKSCRVHNQRVAFPLAD